jgi:hypothetical protein
VSSIAEWRKKYKAFQPIDGQIAEPFIFKQYPGSPKGPEPEDDPSYFIDWFAKNHP